MTQNEFASHVGLDPAAMSRMLSPKGNLPLTDHSRNLMNLIGVPELVTLHLALESAAAQFPSFADLFRRANQIWLADPPMVPRESFLVFVTGSDRGGTLARVATGIEEASGTIQKIDQTIRAGRFVLSLVVEKDDAKCSSVRFNAEGIKASVLVALGVNRDAGELEAPMETREPTVIVTKIRSANDI